MKSDAAQRLRAFAEDLIAEIGLMRALPSWSKVETEARRSAYDDVLAVISDRLAALPTYTVRVASGSPEPVLDAVRLRQAWFRAFGEGDRSPTYYGLVNERVDRLLEEYAAFAPSEPTDG